MRLEGGCAAFYADRMNKFITTLFVSITRYLSFPTRNFTAKGNFVAAVFLGLLVQNLVLKAEGVGSCLVVVPSDYQWTNSSFTYTENTVSRGNQNSILSTVMQKEFSRDFTITAEVELLQLRRDDAKGILIQGSDGNEMTVVLDDAATLTMYSTKKAETVSSNIIPLELGRNYNFNIEVTETTITGTVDGIVVSAPNDLTPPYKLGVAAQRSGVIISEIVVCDSSIGFQVIEGNFTWQEAKADAEAKGGRLAVLDTQEKIDAANSYLEELGEWPHLWIGLTDEAEEGNWKWIDGIPLSANNWKSNEPNNTWFDGISENYVTIASSSTDIGGTWNDTPAGAGLIWRETPLGSYLLEILERLPAPPVVELDSFYESNPLEEIVIDATPSEGFPQEFTYQWSFNDQPIPSFLGGTLPTFSLLGDQSQDGTWKVVVSNTVGTTEASFEYRMFVDNDSDGLSNYREENITLTNPDLADSDSDGLSDPDELSIHGTDPNVADVDEDGLNDSEEIAATTDPSVADTDNDGILDGAEVKTYASNPKSGDTDNDGIADAAEVAAGLDINTAESIANAVAFLTQELANRPPVDGFEEAIAAARTTGREDVTSNPSLYSLYDQTAYNAVIAERDARLTLEEVKDGRLGSVLLLPDAQTNMVRLRFCIEESDELGQWVTREEQAEVEIPLDPDKKFFRFSVKEDE